MKLFHKIFLCFVMVLGIAFQIAGYILINFAYETAIEQEKKYAFQDFQYNRYILQSILYSESEFFTKEEAGPTSISRSFTVPIGVYGADGKNVFSNMTFFPDKFDFENKEDDRLSFQICVKEGESYIFVFDYVSWGENGMYLMTQTDISSVVDNQKSLITYFQKIYIALLCISFPVVYLMTKAITAPIKKVGKAARQIAGGEYSERIETKRKDEIGELATDFNLMAEQVEEKIAELSDAARQKEDFTANFAHELKTPLTSVIGYADMLYQRNLPREEVKNAAEYILNEGMRLESLSLKLMDLFVLNKQDFFLEKMSVQEIFHNLKKGMQLICEKNGVVLHLKLQEGSIKVEFDFFKTMILNLIDNAIKAESKEIWITGEQDKNIYQIAMKDNGKGIPPDELDRIAEAFYMVDKSRSRKQHGAGLGMALVSKIVEIHRAEMKIESDGMTGTVIHIAFQMQEENRNE